MIYTRTEREGEKRANYSKGFATRDDEVRSDFFFFFLVLS